MFRAVNAVEEGLSNASPEDLGFTTQGKANQTDEAQRDALQEQKQNEVDGGIIQLESLLNATVDKDFDKFEIYTLRNILAVGHEEENLAPWVQLEHYKNLDLRPKQNAPTAEQVQLQRRKLHETAKLNTMLRAEEARNAAVIAQLQRLLGASTDHSDQPSPFAILAPTLHTGNPARSQQLRQSTQAAMSQLPAVRELLAQLKESLQVIPNTRIVRENPDSTDAKRRRYIDSQSRRAISRKGLGPDNGEGMLATSGRKIGRDEVEGMEAVVQALGGAGNDRMDE